MHLELAALEAGLDDVRKSPTELGTLELIVARPAEDARRVLDEARIDLSAGLVGDDWRERGPDPERDRQLTVMNARAIALVAQSRERWALAGDQLYVDLDLSEENLPPGTRLAIGETVIEVSAAPHRGCKKFAARFGLDALRFVNSTVGYALHLRGINARVVTPGTVHTGDTVRKLPPADAAEATRKQPAGAEPG